MPTGYSKKTGMNPFKGKKRPLKTRVKMSKPKSEEHRLKVIAAITGTKRSNKTKEKMSLMRKGVPKSESFRRNLSEIQKGDKSHFWKGGVTLDNMIVRSSLEYKLWREAVFKRDNFTCQKTGARGGDLAAHHIFNFSMYTDLRFAIDNGITLSKKAHRAFHKKYGSKNNTREQLEEFLLTKRTNI